MHNVCANCIWYGGSRKCYANSNMVQDYVSGEKTYSYVSCDSLNSDGACVLYHPRPKRPKKFFDYYDWDVINQRWIVVEDCW